MAEFIWNMNTEFSWLGKQWNLCVLHMVGYTGSSMSYKFHRLVQLHWMCSTELMVITWFALFKSIRILSLTYRIFLALSSDKFLRLNVWKKLYRLFDIVMILHVSLLFQTDVSYFPCVVYWNWPGMAILGPDGHRSSGQQTISVRLSPLLVAGGGKGWSAPPHPSLHASRLAIYRGTTSKANRVFWET